MYSHIMATSGSSSLKQYPRLDKICDAAFVRKTFGTTKKDAISFILENNTCKRFFENKEQEIADTYDTVRNDIFTFLQSSVVRRDLDQFKMVIKQRQAQDKQRKKELEKEAIISEYLREQETKKKEEQLLAKITPNSDQTNRTSDTTIQEVSKEKTKKAEDADEALSEEETIDLNDLCQILNAIIDQGLLVIKSSKGMLNIMGVSLDVESEKIIIQTKATPTVIIKK